MEIYIEKSVYAQKAVDLFKEGFNCSQSVFLAFEDMYKMAPKTALMLSSSFGGGMGRLREVCGAVSGMFMVAGVLYGYDDPKDYEAKKVHYERIQQLAKEFELRNVLSYADNFSGWEREKIRRLRRNALRSITKSVPVRNSLE